MGLLALVEPGKFSVAKLDGVVLQRESCRQRRVFPLRRAFTGSNVESSAGKTGMAGEYRTKSFTSNR